MYNTQTTVDREFMRRMIRAYEQDLVQLLNETPDHPGGDWAHDHLNMLNKLRSATFSSFTQTVIF